MAFSRGGRSAGPPGRLRDGAPVHLLVGEETFLRERRLRELSQQFAPSENPDYNLETFAGPDLDLSLVVSACEMLPMLADRRLVVVKSLDLKSAASHAGFLAYLARPNPTTVLLLSSDGGGGGKDESSAAAGKRAKRGSVKDVVALIPSREDFGPLTPAQALDRVRAAARERGVEIAADAVRELVDRVGVDASRLEDEIEKATLYVGRKRRIEVADIDALARRTRGHTVFELTDAIAAGDGHGVMTHLGALLEEGSEPIMLLGMIAWHFRRTLRGAALAEAGSPASEIGGRVGVFGRLASPFGETCRKLGTRGAAKALRALSEADVALKSTAEEPRIVLERTLLGLLRSGASAA